MHTFPFVYCDIRDGVWKERYDSKLYYWSGFLALAPQVSRVECSTPSFLGLLGIAQTYLVLLSWGPCRNRYYEIFKKMHYLCVSALNLS